MFWKVLLMIFHTSVFQIVFQIVTKIGDYYQLTITNYHYLSDNEIIFFPLIAWQIHSSERSPFSSCKQLIDRKLKLIPAA